MHPEGVVQLRLEAPLVAAWGDRFVVRRYSPALTIGGGTVLDPHPAKHRRFDADLLDHLRVLECGELRQVVERWILAVDDRLKSERDLLGELGIGPERLQEVLGELVAAGMVVRVDSEGRAQLLHSSVRGRWGEWIEAALADFHRSEPLKPGLRREELRNLSARYAQPELFDCVLRHLVDEGRVAMDGAVVRAASHGIRFTPEEEATRTEIEKRLNTTAFTDIPDAAGLARALAVEQQQIEALLRALQELEVVVSLEGGLLVHREALVLVQDRLRAYLQADGEITVAQFRELIGSNRKYAMALLGYFDAAGFTARDGDVRVLLS